MKLEKEIGKKSCAVIKLTYMYQVTTLISYARLPDVSSRTQKHCQNKIASYLFKLFKKRNSIHISLYQQLDYCS